jgi:hypothetical protein
MAPRALGALLAIVAAIAFVVSVASSSWWSGHPDVAGHTITAKDVRVGLLGATGCNTGGDGRCEPVEVTSSMQTAGLVELGAIGLTTILAFMLAVSAWRIGDRRKTLANVTIFLALLTAVGAVGVLLIGPAIHASQSVSVPIGWGTFVFGGGMVAVLAASGIARTLEPEPFRLKPSLATPPVAPNVRDILREQHEGLRPSHIGMDPSGSRPSVPLIGGAPQLRPLYDPGNEGFVPAPVSPPLPLAPPTPVPQSMIDQITGNRAPLAVEKPPMRGQTPSASPPVMRSSAPSVPPPIAGAKPPAPSVPMPARTSAPSVPMPARKKPTAAPPIAPPPPRAQTHQGHGTDPDARPVSRTSSPRLSGAPSVSSTKAHAVPPMPTLENTPPPLVIPGRAGRAQTEADDRLDKAMRPTDYVTTVELDAALNAAAAQVGEVTETNLHVAAQRVPNTSEDEIVIAPPSPRGRLQHGEELSSVGKPVTLELAAQTVLTDSDPLGPRALGPPGLTGQTRAPGATGQTATPRAESAPPSRTTYEIGAQTAVGAIDPLAGDSGIALGGITDEIAAQRMTGEMSVAEAMGEAMLGEPLTDQLARQQHDGSDVTDPQGPHGTDITRRPDDRLPLTGPSGTDVSRRVDDRRPSTHAPRGADHTPIPTHSRTPISTAPSHLSPPKPTEIAASGPTPACPQCESPMAWVEEHLRFYCKQCRMYF